MKSLQKSFCPCTQEFFFCFVYKILKNNFFEPFAKVFVLKSC